MPETKLTHPSKSYRTVNGCDGDSLCFWWSGNCIVNSGIREKENTNSTFYGEGKRGKGEGENHLF